MGDHFDPTYLAKIRERLAVLDGLQERREAALRGTADLHSAASRDAGLPEARFVRIYAGQTCGVALDHLLAWRLIVHGLLIPINAHLTLLRGAIENADRCRWHVDHKIRPGKRVGRALAARRDDQEHRRTYEAAKGPGPRMAPGPRGRTGAQRLEELADPDVIKRLRLAGVEPEGYADPTSVVSSYGHERWYRLASGTAHGKEWTLGYVAKLEQATHVAADPGTGAGRFSVSEKFTADLTDVAVRASDAAVRALERYVSG